MNTTEGSTRRQSMNIWDIRRFEIKWHKIWLQIEHIREYKDWYRVSGSTKKNIWFSFDCDKKGISK
jgi:hypothetical protein